MTSVENKIIHAKNCPKCEDNKMKIIMDRIYRCNDCLTCIPIEP
jgi:ribosomal protein L37AE/L43A